MEKTSRAWHVAREETPVLKMLVAEHGEERADQQGQRFLACALGCMV